MTGLTGSLGTAAADPVALAPLETLGNQAKVPRATQTTIARALAGVPGVELIDSKRVQQAIDKKPSLRTCDGGAACLSELGRELGARYVVYGELGGLARVEIVYLEVIDVASGKELRSTTAELGGAEARANARAAAFRLLAPERYVGSLAVTVDVAGASIYVDGSLLARSPARPLSLAVGTHALRVTHPEFRDFVRFVDVEFDRPATIRVDLLQYATVTRDMAREGKGDPLGGNVVYRGSEPAPWYRRWYAVAGFGAAVTITSAVVIGVLAGGIDADRIIDIDKSLAR